VLAELEAYGLLLSLDGYCVVFDTIVDDMPAVMFPDRPSGPSNNPKTAVWESLKTHHKFEINRKMDHKLFISVAPDGYLKTIN
jgi:cephalosporin hydroxylase